MWQTVRQLLEHPGSLFHAPAPPPLGLPDDPRARVEISPTPCDVHDLPDVVNPPWPNMWYYRTALHNRTDNALQVIDFGMDGWTGTAWESLATILKRPYTGADFAAWYRLADGTAPRDGSIPPDGVAADPRNWHGGPDALFRPVRWRYTLETPAGERFTVGAVVESQPIRRGALTMRRRCCGGRASGCAPLLPPGDRR